MNKTTIVYTTKIASEKDILNHLNDCNTNFKPNLNETVNIQQYSNKLFLKSITFEAWLDETLIGLIAVYFNDFKTNSAYITNVSVIKEYFGLGLASHLLEMCITYAKNNSFSNIKLEVSKVNLHALNLYGKFGFNLIKSKKCSFIMKLEF